VVWAISEGRKAAAAVDQYLANVRKADDSKFAMAGGASR